jgi:hypothetical protein
MYSDDIKSFIIRGSENPGLEYKDSMNWKHWETKLKVIRAMLAMANHIRGGVIVLGVKESCGRFDPQGMILDDFNSFNYDSIGRVIRKYSDPLVEFDFLADTIEIESQERRFIVIQVKESIEPTICIKYGLKNKEVGHHPQNICLRENAVYIRSKAPIESREVATLGEWRELINRCVEKNKEELFFKINQLDLLPKKEQLDLNKFDNDLKRDNL